MTHDQDIQLMRELSTADGFTRVFYRHLSAGITQEQAFHLTNAEHIRYYDRPRYASYNSFRVARDTRKKTNKP